MSAAGSRAPSEGPQAGEPSPAHPQPQETDGTLHAHDDSNSTLLSDEATAATTHVPCASASNAHVSHVGASPADVALSAGVHDHDQIPLATPATTTTHANVASSVDGPHTTRCAPPRSALPARPAVTSLATTHAFVTGQFPNPRDWLVAVRRPSRTAQEEEVTQGTVESGRPGARGGSAPPPPARTLGGVPSLEQRLDVQGLQSIMKAFSDSVDLPAYLASLGSDEPGSDHHNGTGNTTGMVRSAVASPRVGRPWRDAFAMATESTEGPHATSPTRAEASRARETSHDASQGQKACEGASSAAAATPAPTMPPAGPVKRAPSADDLTAWLVSAAHGHNRGMPPQDSYTRQLSLEDFTRVVQQIVPCATAHEVRELMTKVDYEAHGTIAWTDLATFLVSESRHHIQMAQAKTELDPAMEPRHVARRDMHEAITAVATDVRKRVVLTGGSEGTVRAWAQTDLSPRGLLFSNKHWISGVHCGYRSRYIFITTLDRELFVLDGNSYEVLRLYHGRPIEETTVGVTYAQATLRTVRVGGVKPPSPPPSTAAPLVTSAAAAVAGGGAAGRPVSSTASLRRRPATPQERKEARYQEALQGTFASGRVGADGGGGGLLKGMGARPLTAAMAQQTLVSTDTTPLTSGGRGPYAEKTLMEGVLLGLADAVVCSLYLHTALDEEVMLLGTSEGDVHIYVVDMQQQHQPAMVLKSRRCLHIHPGKTIHKMELLPSLDALMTCSDDGTVRMTSLINAQLLRTFSAHGLPHAHTAVLDMAVCDASKLLVTVGPERSGLVWDLSQETPIAVLEAHNSPCRSCAALPHLEQILTSAADGSLSVFDMANFHRVQSIALGSSHVIRRLVPDDTRQRCLAFARHPFSLRVKRQVTSECPPQYHGPVSAMFTSLYTPVFDTVVTVDQERMVMTWSRQTGKSVFAFLLKDFSDSDAMNQLRLTAASLDELGRRLLTGFHNGMVVVWNAVNGQPVHLITAATAEEERGAIAERRRKNRAKTTGSGRSRALAETIPCGATRQSSTGGGSRNDRPATGRWRGQKGKGAEGGETLAYSITMDTTRSQWNAAQSQDHHQQQQQQPREQQQEQVQGREVTAVGSLVRSGTTYLLFASHRVLYTVPESTTFTIAAATRWSTPEAYGDITAITQVASQSVVCGTTQGALFFYNVLQEQQEGATQHAKELVFAALTGTPAAPHVGSHQQQQQQSPHLPSLGGGAALLAATTTTRRPSIGQRRGSLTGTTATGSVTAHSTGGLFPILGADDDDGHGGGGGGFGGPQQPGTSDTTSGLPASALTTVHVSPNGNTCVSYLRNINSRVTRLVPLKAVSPHVLLSLHADGTVAFWQTLRRMYLGNISLSAAGVDEGKESGGAVVANVNAASTHLVFADEGGNAHVCVMSFRRLEPSSALETAVMTAPNPALYLTAAAAAAARRGGSDPDDDHDAEATPARRSDGGVVPDSLFHARDHSSVILEDNEVVDEKEQSYLASFTKGEGKPSSRPSCQVSGCAAQSSERAARPAGEERVLYVPESFERTWAFGTGLQHIISILVLDPKAAPPSHPHADSQGEEAEAREVDGTNENAGVAAATSAQREPIVVCTNQERYTRVFTLRGDVIGEFGMGEWDVTDPATYCYMGQRTADLPSTMIPYSKLSGDETPTAMKSVLYFDYLAESYAFQEEARQQTIHTANARRSRVRSQVGGGSTLRRGSLGSTAVPPSSGAGGLGTSIVMTPGVAPSSLPGSPSRRYPQQQSSPVSVTVLAASLKETLVTPDQAAAVAGPANVVPTATTATTTTMTNGGDDAVPLAGCQPPCHLSQPLDTTMVKSARLRYGQKGGCRGLVKRDHVSFVRKQAAAAATQTGPVAADHQGTRQPHGPQLGTMSDDDDNQTESSQAENFELQTEFLALLTRGSYEGDSGHALAEDVVRTPAAAQAASSISSPLATVSPTPAENNRSEGKEHTDLPRRERTSMATASGSTPWSKASLATTAPGGGGGLLSSSSSTASLRASPTHGRKTDNSAAAPTILKDNSTPDTAASAPAVSPALVASPTEASGASQHAPLTRRTGAGFAQTTGGGGAAMSAPLASSAVGGTGGGATTTSTRRHKPGGSSVAVRPDSATREADAHAMARTILSTRHDRILNSTVNAATLRALRRVDGGSHETVGPVGSSGAVREEVMGSARYSPSTSRPGSSAANGLSEDLGPTLTPMHDHVNNVLRRRRQHDTGVAATLYGASSRGSAAASATAGTRAGPSSFIAHVSSKLYVAPMPPLPASSIKSTAMPK